MYAIVIFNLSLIKDVAHCITVARYGIVNEPIRTEQQIASRVDLLGDAVGDTALKAREKKSPIGDKEMHATNQPSAAY